jgi:hypothetical protein
MHRKLAQTVKGANEKRSRIELLEDDSLVANVGMGGGTGAQKGKKPRAKRADGGVAAARKRSAGGGIGRSRARRASYESDDESDEEEYARARPSKASKKSNEDSSTRYKEDGFVVGALSPSTSFGRSRLMRRHSYQTGRRLGRLCRWRFGG